MMQKVTTGKKKIIYALVILAVAFIMTGCGHVKSTKQLVKMAKRAHGACEVVSKEEGEECTSVRLRDKLQGFEYTISSSMQDIVIDGSSFGALPQTYDSFELSLQQFVKERTAPKLDEICKKYGATYDNMFVDEVILRFTLDHDMPDSNAVHIVEEAALAFQEYNAEHRMDGMEVYVEHDEEWLKKQLETHDEINGLKHDYMYSGAGNAVARHMGSAVLPDCVFRDLEAEHDAYYMEMALMTDRRSKFLRKEKKTLDELGLIPEDVNAEYGKEDPRDGSYVVTVYHFTTGVQEYYILDVLNADSSGWYTNYEDEKVQNKELVKEVMDRLFTFHVYRSSVQDKDQQCYHSDSGDHQCRDIHSDTDG